MKKLLFGIATALLMFGCAREYDDTMLKDRVDSLKKEVAALDARVAKLEGKVEALVSFPDKIIKTLEPIKDAKDNVIGYTVTYVTGETLVLQIDFPAQVDPATVVGLKKEGDVYWLTLGGEKICPAGNAGIAIDENGHLWVDDVDYGAIQDAVIKAIDETDEGLLITLFSGDEILIPVVEPFALVLEFNAKIVKEYVSALKIGYEISGKTETTSIDGFADNIYTFDGTEKIEEKDYLVFSVAESVPFNPKGHAVVWAKNGSGLTDIQKITFGGNDIADVDLLEEEEVEGHATPVAAIAESEAGSVVEVSVVSNVPATIIPGETWIKVATPKSVISQSFELEANPTDEWRFGVVNVVDPETADSENPVIYQSFEIAQKPSSPRSIAKIIESIPETATSSSTAAEFKADLENPAVVTYVNGKNAYIEDETGAILLFLEGHGLEAGNTIKGKLSVKAYWYNGIPELVAIGDEFEKGAVEELPLTDVTIKDLKENYDKYLLRRVKLTEVTVTDAIADGDRNGKIAQGTDTLAVYAQINNGGLKLDKDAIGDFVTIPGLYKTTQQVYLWDNNWFTKLPSTVAEIIAKIPTTADKDHPVEFKANIESPATVSYINGNNAYIEDETGGLLIYLKNHGLVVGDRIRGLIEAKAYWFNGIPELVAIGNKYTKTDGEPLAPAEVTIAQLLANYDSYLLRYIKIAGVTVTGGIANGDRNGEIAQGEDKIAVYAQLSNKGLTLTEGDTGDLICIPGKYNTNKQVYFWDNAWFTKAAAPIAITIDNSIADWDAVETSFEGINDRIKVWKVFSDTDNIYFLYKMTASKIKADGSSKFYIGFNLDNDASTGSQGEHGAAGNNGGLEALAYFYPWDGTTAILYGENEDSYIECPVGTKVDGKINVGGVFGDDGFAYVEISVPRASLGSPTGDITVKTAVQYYPTTAEKITLN